MCRFDDSASDLSLSVEEVLTSNTVKVSPSGIFALRFLAMGYPGGFCQRCSFLFSRIKYIPIAPRPMNPHDASRDADWEKYLLEGFEARIQRCRRAGPHIEVFIVKCETQQDSSQTRNTSF